MKHYNKFLNIIGLVLFFSGLVTFLFIIFVMMSQDYPVWLSPYSVPGIFVFSMLITIFGGVISRV